MSRSVRARTGVIVVASHLPGEGVYQTTRFPVVPVQCDDDYDYWRGLAAVWEGPATIINVEHDMDVTDEHVSALLACPHPLCSWAYQAHWITTHLSHDVWAAGPAATGPDDPCDDPKGGYCYPEAFLYGDEEWACSSAIGLVKITAAARTGPLRRERWSQLELSVKDAVRRPWHMHWSPPLDHHHW